MRYGIGRVPSDVDLTSEALAELEAAQIAQTQQAEQMTAWEAHRLRNWRCCSNMDAVTHAPLDDGYHAPDGHADARCDGPFNLQIYRSGTPGSAVNCERHWLHYHAAHGSTVDEVLAWYRDIEERETAEEHICVRCGRHGATWNSGAGQYLCKRDWSNY